MTKLVILETGRKLKTGEELTEFRLTGRDSLCPAGASFVSTMPPSPSGDIQRGERRNKSSCHLNNR